MKLINAEQGSELWHEFRANHFSASLAPSMMGVSKYVSREKLLHMMATGDEQEFTNFQKKILEKGHEVEELARPIASGLVGEPLFRVTASDDDEILSASYDGLTMGQDTAWECKQYNKDKAADVNSGKIPEVDFWQVVQQCAIGPERCLYTVTDGTAEGSVHVWYERNEDDVARLKTGWALFEKDLKEIKEKIATGEYVPPVKDAVGETQTELPTVYVKVSGEIDLKTNISDFGEALKTFVKEHLITEPETDEDFATLQLQIKTLEKAEKALNDAEAQALAQVVIIDEMKRQKDVFHALARDNRLMAKKLVEAKKQQIRTNIISDSEASLNKYIDTINGTLDGVTVPRPKVDFAAAIKGKQKITSVREAAASAVANAKIDVTETADQIRTNLKQFEDVAADHKTLFPDLQQIITKPKDDFVAVVKLRIHEHIEAEKKRKEEKERREEEERKQREESQQKDEAITSEATQSQPDSSEAMPGNITAGKLHNPVLGNNATSESASSIWPSETEIITVIAQHYKVQRSVATKWLQRMEF